MIREPKILTYLAVAGIDCSNYFVEEMVEAAVAAVEHALVAVVVAASSFVVVAAAAAAGASFEIAETFPEVEYSYCPLVSFPAWVALPDLGLASLDWDPFVPYFAHHPYLAFCSFAHIVAVVVVGLNTSFAFAVVED